MEPAARLQEAEKQTRIVHDELGQDAEDLPPGLVEEIGTIAEQLRRAIHALDQEEPRGGSP